MIDIGDFEAIRLRIDESSAKCALFSAFRIGGTLWKRTRYSGGHGGVTGRANTVSSVAHVELFVARSEDVTLAYTAAGTQIPQDQYEFVSPGNVDVQTGDVIQDESNLELTFTIKTSLFNGFDRSGVAEQRGRVV